MQSSNSSARAASEADARRRRGPARGVVEVLRGHTAYVRRMTTILRGDMAYDLHSCICVRRKRMSIVKSEVVTGVRRKV